MKFLKNYFWKILKVVLVLVLLGQLTGCIVAAAAVAAGAGTAGTLYFDKNYQIVKKDNGN